VLVTADGQLLLAQARRVLDEARLLLQLARGRDMGTLAGQVRLGAIETLGPYLFPHLLRPLRAEFPDMALLLREGRTQQLLDALSEGSLDAALVALPAGREQLTERAIFFEPFFLVHSREQAVVGRAPVALDGLDSSDLILLDEGHCLRQHALAACRAPAGAETHRHAASLETLRHLVAAGAGYSVLPALAVPADPGNDPLLGYVPFDPPAGRTIGLVWRASDTRTAGLEALAAFMTANRPAGTGPAA
jgi:LysR family hydrogen peroxide-inducible transcriptional activator